MDDCSLETLSVKPGKLSPAFKRNTTEYYVTVASNVTTLAIDCFASDSGASYTISVMKRYDRGGRFPAQFGCYVIWRYRILHN